MGFGAQCYFRAALVAPFGMSLRRGLHQTMALLCTPVCVRCMMA